MATNEVTANAEPNSKEDEKNYYVIVKYCEDIPTLVGDEKLEDYCNDYFGLFTLQEARNFVVKAFRGGLDICNISDRPIIAIVHTATIYVCGDSPSDYIKVKTWVASEYKDTDCSRCDTHEAGELY